MDFEKRIKKIYSIARKKGEFEANFGDYYFRVCYDSEFDKHKKSLSSYIDLKKGCYLMKRRSQKELLNILKYNNINLCTLKKKIK